MLGVARCTGRTERPDISNGRNAKSVAEKNVFLQSDVPVTEAAEADEVRRRIMKTKKKEIR